ncbi:MAG: discoidin domain-containing protein [Actinomycetota bacterium]
MGVLRRLFDRARHDRGASGIEYALVVAVLVVGSMASLESIDERMEDNYQSTADDIGNPDLADFGGSTPQPPESSLAPPPPVPPTNLALGRPAIASSTWNAASTTPAVVTDGNTSGDWNDQSTYATASEPAGWVEVDLQQIGTLDEVRLWNRQFCCVDRSQDVEVWVDGVYIGTAPGILGYPSTVDLGGITGSVIRIVNGHPGSQLLQLAEVEVIGIVP